MIKKVKRYIPTPGATIALENFDKESNIIFANTLPVSNVPIVWPTAPKNGDRISFQSVGDLTNITHTGGSLNIPFTSMKAGGGVEFVYDAIGLTWMVVQSNLEKSDTRKALAGSVNASGNVVIYATDDGTATGNALFSSIEFVTVQFDTADPDAAFSKPVVSNGNKTITIACKKRTFALATVLGITVLQSSSLGNSPAGTAVTILISGKAV